MIQSEPLNINNNTSTILSEQVFKPLFQDKILELNDIKIIARKEDGYINATAMCKAGGKNFIDYTRNKQTQAYLQALSTAVGISNVELFQVQHGGRHAGSWIHRKVAYHLAQWISPNFAVKVSLWLDELALTGRVELGNEKSIEELEYIYKTKISKLEADLSQREEKITTLSTNLIETQTTLNILRRNHTKILRKRTYYKLNTGNCLYILVDSWRETLYYKIGISDDINHRLLKYKTSMPELKLLYLIYLEPNASLEIFLKLRFKDNLVLPNREYLNNISLDEIINGIHCILKSGNITEYKVEELLDKYNFDTLLEDNTTDDKIEDITECINEPENSRICGSHIDPEHIPMLSIETYNIIKYKIDSYTLKELRDILVRLKVPTTGRKDDLKQRILIKIEEDMTGKRACSKCRVYLNLKSEFVRLRYDYDTECKKCCIERPKRIRGITPANTPDNHKYCCKCKTTKHTDEFYKSKKYGLNSCCIGCEKIRRAIRTNRAI